MSDLTDFLLARLDEQQAEAEEVTRYLTPGAEIEIHLSRRDGDETRSKIVRPYDPARVLADVAAKRAIIADPLVHDFLTGKGISTAGRRLLLHLAQPYADHADFDPRWRV